MRGLGILLLIISLWANGYSQSDISVIKFDDLTIEIHSLMPFDSDDLNGIFESRAEFAADLGETLESSTIIIKSEKYSHFEIFQAAETSLTISDEGPHCDLIEWKHFTSDWKMLDEVTKNTFNAFSYDSNIDQKFPDVTVPEVVEATKKHCGSGWADHIKNIKSIHDYPCSVGISKYLLKVIATDNSSGRKIEKTIWILIPMGC
jgi:hypothetical protein